MHQTDVVLQHHTRCECCLCVSAIPGKKKVKVRNGMLVKDLFQSYYDPNLTNTDSFYFFRHGLSECVF